MAPRRKVDAAVPERSEGSMPETPVVFISSTAADLRPHREAARDAALAATPEFGPRMMESFEGRGDNPPLGVCLEKVAEADVVVAIVAHRYGWEPPDQPGAPDEWKSIAPVAR
jgi:hypothetical protein